VGDPARPARQARALPGVTLGLCLGLTAVPVLPLAAAPAVAAEHVCPEPESWRRDRLDTSFERERRLAGMTIPLRSHGRVQSDGTAIWWRTEAPLEMVLRIDQSGVSQSVAGGAMQPLAGAGAGGGEIASLITTLLSGDLASAAAAFTIDRQQDPATGKWHVRLQPKAAQLARAIGSIELTGCERVEVVLIRQPNGDQDRVVFGQAD
jgi:hypothetical protein